MVNPVTAVIDLMSRALFNTPGLDLLYGVLILSDDTSKLFIVSKLKSKF